MRRIYLAFAKRIVTHDVTMQVALFGFALVVFAKMVHVASVIDNFMNIPVADVPAFIFSALSQGEVVTLFAIGALVFTALSLPWRFGAMVLPKLRTL